MRSVRSTTARPLAALAAAAVAALAVAAAPGAAHAAEDDRIDCVVSRNIAFMSVTYTCETQSQDTSWYVTGSCISPIHNPMPLRSATVEGDGSATVGCPVIGLIYSGPADVALVVV